MFIANGTFAQEPTDENRRSDVRVGYGQVKVDGEIDDVWKSAVAIDIDRPVKELTTIASEDAAKGKLKILWDEKFLYLLADVTDNSLNANNPAAWEQDSIEFFVDENREQSQRYQPDDGQYRVTYKGLISYGQTTRGKLQAIAVRTEGGYRVEASIGWQTIVPGDESQIGFEAQINDDAGEGKRQALLKWNQPSDTAWKDTSGFGTLILSGGPPAGQKVVPEKMNEAIATKNRVPDWAADAIFYQIFPERFRNGDPTNDPTRESLEFPDIIPESWKVTPWTNEWYERAEWEKQLGANFYEDGVFHRRCGGDLQGVIDKLDYLSKLGINTIYFNPVFYARSLHKYDGNSYHHVDPYFGPDPEGDLKLMASENADPKSWHWTKADQLFLQLVREAHDRNIRVIVDGVFNHTGRDFWAFADIAKNQQQSSYLDWYSVKQFDDPATDANEFKYACWWGVDTLPEFADNEDGTDLHPKPKAYIFQATARWMDPNSDGDPSDGIDGWRLDVANEVPNQFWRDWNQEVRNLNPDALTVAEFWDDAGNYLEDCGFSSTMNYYGFAYPCKGFLVDNRLPVSEFAGMIADRMQNHPAEVRYALQNLMDSHDVDRLASQIVNADNNRPYLNPEKFDYDVGDRVSPRHFGQYDVSRPGKRHQKILKLTALFQLTFVGAPMIYYGTESGMDGADDPDDRMPMVWDDLDYAPRTVGPLGPLNKTQPISFDGGLFEFYRNLIKVRNDSQALRRGDFKVLRAEDRYQALVFSRTLEDENVVVAINRGKETATLKLDDEIDFSKFNLELILTTNPDRQMSGNANNDQLRIPALTGAIWKVVKRK